MQPINNFAFNDDVGGVVEDQCGSSYDQKPGLLVIPVMGPVDTPPVVVQVHAPYTLRKSVFSYARNRTPPLVPPMGDTQLGDIYLGGRLTVPAPTQDAKGILAYAANGAYNYVTASDVQSSGKVRFDAHGHRTLVDFLGWFNLREDPNVDDTWNSPYFDMNTLASARILG